MTGVVSSFRLRRHGVIRWVPTPHRRPLAGLRLRAPAFRMHWVVPARITAKPPRDERPTRRRLQPSEGRLDRLVDKSVGGGRPDGNPPDETVAPAQFVAEEAIRSPARDPA